ncbi:MAG: BatA domain-containing protein [Planctomycetota bacterium]
MLIGLAFLHPLVLWGLPLAAVPIIIHLLNRRRFDTRRWAAMEFLLRAMQRNRRRLRMEQWLILALRTLAILLLVLLVARPQWSGGAIGGSATHHIVVLDTSASMSHRGGADTAFDRGVTTLEDLAANLAETASGDFLTLIRSDRVDEPLLALAPIGPDLPRRVRDTLGGGTASDLGLDVPAVLDGLAAASAAAADVAPQVEHVLITDLRRRDWLGADGAVVPSVRNWLAELDPERARFTLLDVGSRDARNLAVTAVRLDGRTCVAGLPARIAIDVTNHGPESANPTEVNVEIGPSRFAVPVPEVLPGETVTVRFEQTFRTPGWHGVHCALPEDRYAPDDARSLAVEARRAVRVLVVDGDPATEPEDAESFFVAVALDPGGDGASGVEARVVADHEFETLSETDLGEHDLVWICNVARIGPELAARLESYVDAGGGLAIWLGDRVDLGAWHETMWRGGQGLLPLPLGEVDGDLDTPRGIHLAAEDHPLFDAATDALRLMFAELCLVGRFVTMEDRSDAPVQRLLRVGAADGPLLMAARSRGDRGGSVHVVGTSADAAWTNLPAQFVFPILADRLVRTASRVQDQGARDLRPDATFVVGVDPAIHRPDVEIRARDGSGEVFTFAALPDRATEVEVPMAQLQGLGLFDVVRALHGGGQETETLARNALVDEGELGPTGGVAFSAAVPEDLRSLVRVREIGAGEPVVDDGARGASTWRFLGALLLLGLLAETVLAWRFGRR